MSQNKLRIRTYNNIDPEGLAKFSNCISADIEVGSDIENPDAILLRSYKLGLDDIPASVRAIARAGAGYNNIPVDECSKAGVVVMNTPGANANAVTELVLAGMLLSERHLHAALRYSSELDLTLSASEMNTQVEAAKKRFSGNELRGMAIGILGLGAIGSRVANLALSLGMQVYGYDPYLNIDAAWQMPTDVVKCETIEQMLGQVDFVTLHIPATPETTNTIDAKVLQSCKPSAVLLNFARAPVVDDAAVIDALNNKKLRAYVCDFPTAELVERQQKQGDVIVLPHLGASTAQAESNCATMAADQLLTFLLQGNVINSVNFPYTVSGRQAGDTRISIANRNVPAVLSSITGVLSDVNVVDLTNKSRGDFAWTNVDIDAPLSDGHRAQLQQIDGVLRIHTYN